MKMCVHLTYLAEFFSEREIVQKSCMENKKTFYVQYFYSRKSCR